jgi:hypothetical protein
MELEELEAQIENLTEQVTVLTVEKTALSTALEEKTAMCESLEAELASKKDSINLDIKKEKSLTAPIEPFTIKGKKYRLLYPFFRIGAQRVDAKDALKDDALCARIVKDYPDLIEEV